MEEGNEGKFRIEHNKQLRGCSFSRKREKGTIGRKYRKQKKKRKKNESTSAYYVAVSSHREIQVFFCKTIKVATTFPFVFFQPKRRVAILCSQSYIIPYHVLPSIYPSIPSYQRGQCHGTVQGCVNLSSWRTLCTIPHIIILSSI